MTCGTKIQCSRYWSDFVADQQKELKEETEKQFLEQGLKGALYVGDRFCALYESENGYFDLKVIDNDQVKWLDGGKRQAVPKIFFVMEDGTRIRWAGDWAWDIRRFRWSCMQLLAKQLTGPDALTRVYIVARSLWRIVDGQFKEVGFPDIKWHSTGRYEMLQPDDITVKGVNYAVLWEWISRSPTAIGKGKMYSKRALRRGLDQKFNFMGHRYRLEGRMIKKTSRL